MSHLELSGFFGHPAAHQDRQEFSDFRPIPAYKALKKGKSGSKIFVSGVFGSGKSAILSKVAAEAPKKSIVWELNERKPPLNQLDYSQLGKQTGALAYLTLNTLLWELVNLVLQDQDRFSKDALATLKRLLPSVLKRFGKKVLSSVKLSDPLDLVEIDFDRLIQEKGGALSRTLPLDEWRQALSPCLAEVPAYMLLDDIELIFPGVETIPQAADALLYASEMLNDTLKEGLTCLVAVQFSTLLMLERKSKRFEKVTTLTEKISWAEPDLRALLAGRVREKKKVAKAASDLDVLLKVFEAKSKKELESVISRATSVCVNGPRDLIGMCNAAHERAGGGKIGRAEIDGVLADFGDLKLGGLEREFQEQFPGIRQFVERSFSDGPSRFSSTDLEGGMTVWLPEARKVFGKVDWLTAASRQVVANLYEVGFLGCQAAGAARPKFLEKQLLK